jgi:hypothetical protein
MAQTAEYLPFKCEELSSNPSTAKKKKREKTKKKIWIESP